MIIRDLLRKDMGFEGLVMTDDLDMGAILNHYGFDETMRLGIEVGNDLLMICHRVEMAATAKKAIDSMGKSSMPLSNPSRVAKPSSPPRRPLVWKLSMPSMPKSSTSASLYSALKKPPSAAPRMASDRRWKFIEQKDCTH